MVVAAGQAVLLAFVDVGDCGIPKVLRELFFSHMGWKRVIPPALYTSAGMASDPGVFLVDICLMAFSSALILSQASCMLSSLLRMGLQMLVNVAFLWAGGVVILACLKGSTFFFQQFLVICIQDMKDHRSYMHNLRSCEIEEKKNQA